MCVTTTPAITIITVIRDIHNRGGSVVVTFTSG